MSTVNPGVLSHEQLQQVIQALLAIVVDARSLNHERISAAQLLLQYAHT